VSAEIKNIEIKTVSKSNLDCTTASSTGHEYIEGFEIEYMATITGLTKGDYNFEYRTFSQSDLKDEIIKNIKLSRPIVGAKMKLGLI